MSPETKMWVNVIAFDIGVLVALILGTQTDHFLRRSVIATVPRKIKLPDEQENGGAAELGTLEILLYFASLWLQQYILAGAWLAFKVAAKWAAWQHIAKISDKRADNDIYLLLRERLQLSNALLGRFLNGTLFNIICAGVGLGVAVGVKNVLLHYHYSYEPDVLFPVSVLLGLGIVTALVAALLTVGLLFFWHPKK